MTNLEFNRGFIFRAPKNLISRQGLYYFLEFKPGFPVSWIFRAIYQDQILLNNMEFNRGFRIIASRIIAYPGPDPFADY